MNMTEAELMGASPEYWQNKLKGWRKLQFDTERAAWDRTRWMTAVLIQPYSKKTLRPFDLLMFPDEVEERRKETIEKVKQMRDDPRFPKTLPN